MSYSLWAVNGHSNIVRHYIEDGSASEAVKNRIMGECLLWKAMAYFYLVRTFGDVPIVHDNVAMIEDNTYNEQPKVYKADVYEYIVMTLEKAIEPASREMFRRSPRQVLCERPVGKGLPDQGWCYWFAEQC